MKTIILSITIIGFGGDLSAANEPHDLANGRLKYEETCVACHGENGKPTIPGIPDFTSRKGPLQKTDDQLFKSIMDGVDRPEADMAMPALGGNPDLVEKDIKDILSYMREKFGKK